MSRIVHNALISQFGTVSFFPICYAFWHDKKFAMNEKKCEFPNKKIFFLPELKLSHFTLKLQQIFSQKMICCKSFDFCF